MRSTSPRSTESVPLNLTIPQIPHINSPFLLSALDKDAVFPEVDMHVGDHLFTLEYDLTPTTERASVHCQQSPEVTLLQPHPKEFATHDVVDQAQVSVVRRHNCDVVIVLISHCRRNCTSGI